VRRVFGRYLYFARRWRCVYLAQQKTHVLSLPPRTVIVFSSLRGDDTFAQTRRRVLLRNANVLRTERVSENVSTSLTRQSIRSTSRFMCDRRVRPSAHCSRPKNLKRFYSRYVFTSDVDDRRLCKIMAENEYIVLNLSKHSRSLPRRNERALSRARLRYRILSVPYQSHHVRKSDGGQTRTNNNNTLEFGMKLDLWISVGSSYLFIDMKSLFRSSPGYIDAVIQRLETRERFFFTIPRTVKIHKLSLAHLFTLSLLLFRIHTHSLSFFHSLSLSFFLSFWLAHFYDGKRKCFMKPATVQTTGRYWIPSGPRKILRTALIKYWGVFRRNVS